MTLFHSNDTQRLDGTQRIEAFSDGVFAIVLTILILDVKVPHPASFTFPVLAAALMPTVFQISAFAFSFLVVCIYWVNHHHFYHQLTQSDWPLLWHNNFFLFFLCMIPFTTAFLSEYPGEPFVIAVFAMVLCFATIAFRMMRRHAYFHSNLTQDDLPMTVRKRIYRRGLFAIIVYPVTAAVAFLSVPLAWLGLIAVQFYYFVPRAMNLDEEETDCSC